MKNSIYAISILLTMMSFNIEHAFSQDEPTKSIHLAAADGDIEQITLNIKKGISINQKDSVGNTPFHIALKNKQLGAIDYLLKNGADINVAGEEGATPLYLAVDINQPDVVEMLLARRVNINAVIRPDENALTLARRKQYSQIVDILVKSGATEPVDISMRELYQDDGGGQRRGNMPMDYEYGTNRDRITAEPELQLDFLEDPNAIKATIKKYEGLENSLNELEKKSINEMRQWQMIRADNRIPLLNTFGKQYDLEIALIKNIATEEKAEKTIKAIDEMLSTRQERNKKISQELIKQKKEEKQAEQATRTQGRGRTTQRGARGRNSLETPTYSPDTTNTTYGRRALDSGTMENQAEQAEQEDPQTQEEIDMWLDTTTENKEELVNSVEQLIITEIVAVRTIAKEEKANKTIAAIDGLLLNRQIRFDELAVKMEEARQKLERLAQIQEQRATQQGTRTRGRGRGGQMDSTGGQQNQTRTRRR